tara:strand:+ start:2384 stop:3181 length:798 start_codon:yes stop_codon:yes gene_type:complete
MKNHCYCFNKLVIGGNLSALLYSYEKGLPLIINKLSSPYRFEPEKEKLWNKLYFLLSLSGLNLLGTKTDKIRVNDKEISVTTKDSKVIKVKFDELLMFDDIFVLGLPSPAKEKDEFMVLDWMITKSCAKHEEEHILTGDDFVRDIYFYPTDRLDGNHLNVRDLVSVSYLTKRQLQDFKYSDTYARFKTEKVLKENGITGSKNGFQNGKQINYSLKIEVKKREIKRLHMPLYKDTNNIKFMYESVLDFKQSTLDYANKLNKMFAVS